MKLTKQTVYIGLFSILYLIVAFSSFWHAVSFFGLANNSWMSVILAFAFEVGQAAVLFSLLTSVNDRSRVMPWVLMFMFTLVQVIGNVFSSYKYIVTNSVDNLRYFKEPIFIWTQLPDDQATVIIVYIVGAILPVSALLLTSMITTYLSDQEEIKNVETSIMGTDPDGGVIGEQGEDGLKVLTESLNSKDNEIEQLKQELEELKHPKISSIPVNELTPVQPISEPEGLKQLKEYEDKKNINNDKEETIQENNENNDKSEEEVLIKENETNEEEIHRSDRESENQELQKMETDEQPTSEKGTDDDSNIKEYESTIKDGISGEYNNGESKIDDVPNKEENKEPIKSHFINLS